MRALAYLALCLTLGLGSPAEGRGVGSPGMGPEGPAGAQGPRGSRGEKGEAGAKGPQGELGPQGVPGAQGTKGDRGDAGVQGPAGTPGTKGDAGPAGAAGERGPAGQAGTVGPAGPKGDAGPQGGPGAAGVAGAKGDVGATGPAGAPRRVERYTVTANGSGVATFAWTACAAMPDVDVIPTWSGDQMIVGGVTAQSLSGATVTVKRSRGSLVASAGPFEPAPNTAVTVRVIC